MNSVCSYLRILNHLGTIVEGVSPPDSGAATGRTESSFKPHLATYLKLLLVTAYARNASLRIGPHVTDKLYYMDVLSASGLTYPEGGQQPVPGSCFSVPLANQEFADPRSRPKASFNRSWAFDARESNLALLKARHTGLIKRAGFRLPPLTTVAGDVNDTIHGVLSELAAERAKDFREGRMPSLTLAFVDNEGLDVSMETLHAIQAKIRADLVVHLPLRAVWRSIAQHDKTSRATKALDAFFGGKSVWDAIEEPSDIADAYQASLQAGTAEEFQGFKPVQIKSANQEFALCVFTRKTKQIKEGKRGWAENIRGLADACNEMTPDILETVLKVATKGQRTLDV